jgi:hypothetical protein
MELMVALAAMNLGSLSGSFDTVVVGFCLGVGWTVAGWLVGRLTSKL